MNNNINYIPTQTTIKTLIVVLVITILSSSVKSYLFLSHLLNALTDDSDLSSLASIDIPKVITSLFVATASDCTSYFKNFEKATVRNTFFMHCKFISGVNNHKDHYQILHQKKEIWVSYPYALGENYISKDISLPLLASVMFKHHNSYLIQLNNRHQH